MIRENDPVFIDPNNPIPGCKGLTKIELFTALIAQGLAASSYPLSDVASLSHIVAKSLIENLNLPIKKKEDKK